jgi:hypothetical protein
LLRKLEEQLAHPDERVVKQFINTYKATPKWMVEPRCPRCEVLRVKHMQGNDDREREAIEKSVAAEGQTPGGRGIGKPCAAIRRRLPLLSDGRYRIMWYLCWSNSG